MKYSLEELTNIKEGVIGKVQTKNVVGSGRNTRHKETLQTYGSVRLKRYLQQFRTRTVSQPVSLKKRRSCTSEYGF